MAAGDKKSGIWFKDVILGTGDDTRGFIGVVEGGLRY